MPPRKIRRRRAKLKRHEYEYVIESEEGEEVPVERPRERAETKRDGRAGKEPMDRRGRPIQKPTLQRVMRRTLIFGPLLLIVVYLTSPDGAATGSIVLTAVTLLALFIPFSYMMDLLVYRVLTRRHRRTGG